MKKPRKLLARSVPERRQEANFRERLAVRILVAVLVVLVAAGAPTPLRAQLSRSLTQRPEITIVGVNDKACQDSLADLQRLIREFAFVRGHHIYLVCDRNAWNHVTHHLTLEYGVIVSSRAAISDIRLRESWFYADALHNGIEGHTGDYIYAHELGHFVCSCVDEAAADKAAAQLLDDVRHNRFNTEATTAGASK